MGASDPDYNTSSYALYFSVEVNYRISGQDAVVVTPQGVATEVSIAGQIKVDFEDLGRIQVYPCHCHCHNQYCHSELLSIYFLFFNFPQYYSIPTSHCTGDCTM